MMHPGWHERHSGGVLRAPLHGSAHEAVDRLTERCACLGLLLSVFDIALDLRWGR